MEKDIQVPSFVNDRYNIRKETELKEQKERKIQNLKVYKKALKYLAVGATLAIVMSNPTVQNKIANMIDVAIEKDNERFEEETRRNAEEVREYTGQTVEEIMEKGRSVH